MFAVEVGAWRCHSSTAPPHTPTRLCFNSKSVIKLLNEQTKHKCDNSLREFTKDKRHHKLETQFRNTNDYLCKSDCKPHTVGVIPGALMVARFVQVCYQKRFQTCIAMETFLTFHPWLCYTCRQVTTAPWDPLHPPTHPHFTLTLEQAPEIRKLLHLLQLLTPNEEWELLTLEPSSSTPKELVL